jgi:hypothetical protein
LSVSLELVRRGAGPNAERIPLVAQPSTDPVEVVSEIRSGMATECEHCGKRPKYERLIVRTFGLGVPRPPEDVLDEKLIEDRKALGWDATVRDSEMDFPRFDGHLMAGPSGLAWRMSVDAQDPAVFHGVQA